MAPAPGKESLSIDHSQKLETELVIRSACFLSLPGIQSEKPKQARGEGPLYDCPYESGSFQLWDSVLMPQGSTGSSTLRP